MLHHLHLDRLLLLLFLLPQLARRCIVEGVVLDISTSEEYTEMFTNNKDTHIGVFYYRHTAKDGEMESRMQHIIEIADIRMLSHYVA